MAESTEVELVEASIIERGDIDRISKEMLFAKMYRNALKRIGEESERGEIEKLPRELLEQLDKGINPRLGPLEVEGDKLISIKKLKVKVLNPKKESPLYAVIEFLPKPRVLLAYKAIRPVLGIDIGIRHIFTIASIRDFEIEKAKIFYWGDEDFFNVITRLVGHPQGEGTIEDVRRKLDSLAEEVIIKIGELNPRKVALEDLRRAKGRTGESLKLIQKVIISKMVNRGVRFYFLSAYNSSKRCARCGFIVQRVEGKTFICPACGFRIDRDANAALNMAIKCFYECK